MRCARNPPPCRTNVDNDDNDDNDDAKNDNNSNWQKLPFPWKNIISPFIFAWFFEYFGCQGARPGGLGHILSPRLGFLWFLRFDRRERVPPFWPKNDQKSFKMRSQTQQVFRSLFWSTLKPSWGRFGRILRAKMEPKLIQNRSQERSWRKFKNH